MALILDKKNFHPVAPSHLWEGYPEARNFVYALYFPVLERVEVYSKDFRLLQVRHPEMDALKDFVRQAGTNGCMFTSKSIKTYGLDSAKNELVSQNIEFANPLEGIAIADQNNNTTVGEDLEGLK